MNEKIIGIDLGTTNSEAAIIKDGQPYLFKHDNHPIMPSYVGMDMDDKLIVGTPARNQYPVFPERTVKSIKRIMGSDETITMADREYAPQEISAIILKTLKHTAEKETGTTFAKAVITVPAYFSDAQRQATREAGEIAGFTSIKMINEPTAAAMAYGGGKEQETKTILIYDLGGGTFDVSVVRIEDGVIEVIASHGNNLLGGDDFDQKIIDHIHNFINNEHPGINLPLAAEARIVRVAEQAKISLSDNPFVGIKEEYLFENKGVPVHLDMELSRHDYEKMITPFLDETLEAIHTALEGAGMSARDIDQILLVGGSTRTPLVHTYIEQEFGIPPHGEVNPELCVACGAAIQGAMISGEDVNAVLVDITPYSFSTSILTDENYIPELICVPLIKKNTPIPVKKSEVFFTTFDNQEAVKITAYQGEERDPEENILIGEFTIEGLSKVPAGNEIISTFALDTDGILHVSAMEKCTGLSKSITIDNAASRFGTEEVSEAKDRMINLFGDDNPIDKKKSDNIDTTATDESADEQNSASRNPAVQRLLARASALLETASPEDREDLVDLMERVKDGEATGNKEQLADAISELEEIIFYMES